VEQSPSSEDNLQLFKELAVLYAALMFIIVFTTARPLFLILSQINPVHAPIPLIGDKFLYYQPIYA
jgi:hypothetical protein